MRGLSFQGHEELRSIDRCRKGIVLTSRRTLWFISTVRWSYLAQFAGSKTTANCKRWWTIFSSMQVSLGVQTSTQRPKVACLTCFVPVLARVSSQFLKIIDLYEAWFHLTPILSIFVKMQNKGELMTGNRKGWEYFKSNQRVRNFSEIFSICINRP